MSDAIEALFALYSPDVQAISRMLRSSARQVMPTAHEFVYHAAVNYAVSDSAFDRICYIAPQKNYVTLGFFFGSHLADPHNLLLGEGKRLRHVKVRSLAEASNPALGLLMKAAWGDAPDFDRQVTPRGYALEEESLR